MVCLQFEVKLQNDLGAYNFKSPVNFSKYLITKSCLWWFNKRPKKEGIKRPFFQKLNGKFLNLRSQSLSLPLPLELKRLKALALYIQKFGHGEKIWKRATDLLLYLKNKSVLCTFCKATTAAIPWPRSRTQRTVE